MAKSGESWINCSISSLFSETNAMCQLQHDNLQFEGNLDKGLTLDNMHAQIPNSSERKRPIGSSLNDIHLLDSPLDNTDLEGRFVSNAEERSTVCDMPSERIRDRMLKTDSQTTPRTDAHTQSTFCVRDKGMREKDKHKRKSWHSDEDHQKEFQVLRKSKKIQSTSDSAVSTKGNLLDVLTESCRSRSTIESIELVYNNDLDSSDTEDRNNPTIELFPNTSGQKSGLGIRMFITFSLNPFSDNQVICCEMKALVMGLIKAGISVKMDRCAEAIGDIIENQHDWIDEQISNVGINLIFLLYIRFLSPTTKFLSVNRSKTDIRSNASNKSNVMALVVEKDIFVFCQS